MNQASLWAILEAYNVPDIDLLKYLYEYTTVRLPQSEIESVCKDFDGTSPSVLGFPEIPE